MDQALSYSSGSSVEPLLGWTIGQALDHAARVFAGNEALVSRHQGRRFTYAEFHAEVERLACALLALGIERGERVAIWATNRTEWAIVQFATAKIGAILVTVNPAYRTRELEYALCQSGVSVLFAEARHKSSDYNSMLCELLPELQHSRAGILANSRLPELRHVVGLDETEVAPGMWRWSELLANAGRPEALREREAALDFDDPINIQYTSGTTGAPKGATLTHHNLVNNAYFTARRMHFSSRDRLVIPVPLYHCFGMVLGNLACVTHGATMIYPAASFDAKATLEAVHEERATALYGVPTMFIAELEHPEFARFDLSSLRTGAMGGAVCPRPLMEQVIQRMGLREITVCYGQTETSPVNCQTLPDAPLDKRVATVGTVHPHVEIKIADPVTGRPLPPGTPGELCARGYNVMRGYWRNDEATREAIRNGWMHSGDLAVMDEEGYVVIIGRLKDLIIRGGENVYPREIEEFLLTHPAISDAQVVGLPDPRMGEEVVAWVKLVPGARLNAEEVRTFCRERIAHYKIPRYVGFLEQFPLTVTGKVQKFKLRELAMAQFGPPHSGVVHG
ncbi:MAG: AMP-binding protein [Sinobacteraceae bacterium]|nr:AMP-binding protein [Nevskiaceae bacterium]